MVVLFKQLDLRFVDILELSFQTVKFHLAVSLHLNQLLFQHLIFRSQKTVTLVQILLQFLLFYQQWLNFLVFGTKWVLESDILEFNRFKICKMGLLNSLNLREIVGLQLISDGLGFSFAISIKMSDFTAQSLLFLPEPHNFVLIFWICSIYFVFVLVEFIFLPLQKILQLSNLELIHLCVT